MYKVSIFNNNKSANSSLLVNVKRFKSKEIAQAFFNAKVDFARSRKHLSNVVCINKHIKGIYLNTTLHSIDGTSNSSNFVFEKTNN